MKNLKALLAMTFLIIAAPAGAPTLAQTPPEASGDWRGTLQAGAIRLRLALHLGSTSSFDSIDQNAMGLPAHLTASGRHVSLAIEKVGVFEGDLSEDGKTLAGALQQGPATTPLTFERGVFTPANRPQTPKKPYPYREIEVGYDNPARPGVHLAGAITEPNGKGPFPAVVLITGSGAQDRDETLFEHKPFLVLADALTRRGIAVLRVDDRGTGGSTGAGANDTTADFATDVAAGVAYLRSRPEIDANHIGLLGHSEGGAIAPIVAAKDPKIAFVVLWAGPALRGAEVIEGQVKALTLAAGASPEAAGKAMADQKLLMDAIIAANDEASARQAANQLAIARTGKPFPAATLAQLTSAWYRNFIAYDPAPTLKSVKVPVLALFGGKDVQVTAIDNAPAMRALLAGNPKAVVLELPGLNHLFQNASTGSPDEYGKIEETIAPAALKAMVDWVAKTTGAR